jgi:photosystem II stability/assembly factor-like uncharacterized protein
MGIVSALLIFLVLVLALGSVFVVQLARRPATQATPAPTAAATTTPAPKTTAASTPTPAATATTAPSAVPISPISALWMSDATTGWARTTTHLMLHTTDGGKSWQDVTPPYPSGISAQLPSAFASLSGSMAWVAVSEKQQPNGTYPTLVFRTSDGGHTWQEAMLPASYLGVSQVQFVNAQDGWVLASFGGGAAGSQAVDLFRSTDGGQTWSLVARAPGTIPSVGQKSGMGWVSATTGWITGSIAAAQNTVWLYRTQDGGVSWQPQSLPLPSLQAVITTQPPVFFSATEGLLPVTFYNGKGTSLDIYATHDGGANWSSSTLLSTTGNIWDFLTAQQGWVVGANGTTLNETSDAGQHWTSITPSANFQHISQLDFVSAQEGWAINTTTPTAPVLLKTMDGGQTWVQVSPTPFQVTSVSITVNPTSIAGMSCGTSLTVTYTALFHLAPNGPGGTIHFEYTVNNGRGTTLASLTVAAGQTTASYKFVWSGKLPLDHTYPESGGVMVQSPNAINSPMLGPSGTCR